MKLPPSKLREKLAAARILAPEGSRVVDNTDQFRLLMKRRQVARGIVKSRASTFFII